MLEQVNVSGRGNPQSATGREAARKEREVQTITASRQADGVGNPEDIQLRNGARAYDFLAEERSAGRLRALRPDREAVPRARRETVEAS